MAELSFPFFSDEWPGRPGADRAGRAGGHSKGLEQQLCLPELLRDSFDHGACLPSIIEVQHAPDDVQSFTLGTGALKDEVCHETKR